MKVVNVLDFYDYFGAVNVELLVWFSLLTTSVLYCCMVTHTYGYTYSKSMDQPGKVANPARGQLKRKNEYFPVRVRS